MKKLVLIGVFAAGALFGADLSSDAKAMSEAAFKNRAEAGKLEKQARELKDKFREQLREKLDALSDEDRAKFMSEFRKNMDEKIDKLSVKEARELGFDLGRKGDGRGLKGERDERCGCERGRKEGFKAPMPPHETSEHHGRGKSEHTGALKTDDKTK